MLSLPNFLLISAGRSGTTSLYRYLSQHPQVFMPSNKEPYFLTGIDYNDFKNVPKRFLGSEWVKEIKKYGELFIGASDARAIGEASVSYFYYHIQTIPRIKEFLKDPKIIIILRNPVERAYSHFLHNVQNGLEHLSFEEAISLEEQRIKENWWWGYHYKNAGFYATPLKSFINNFSEVSVWLYDEFSKNSPKVVQEMFQFLDVDESFEPETGIVYNKAIVHKSLYSRIKGNPLLKSVRKSFNLHLPTGVRKLLINNEGIPLTMKSYLAEEFRNDISELEDILNKELTLWKRN